LFDTAHGSAMTCTPDKPALEGNNLIAAHSERAVPGASKTISFAVDRLIGVCVSAECRGHRRSGPASSRGRCAVRRQTWRKRPDFNRHGRLPAPPIPSPDPRSIGRARRSRAGAQ
jgi:hypothetical protein